MHFLYPSDPTDPRRPDTAFREQIGELRKRGLGVSIVCLEDLDDSTCKIRESLPDGAIVVYRGWMLTPKDYEKLLVLIQACRAIPLVSLEAYLSCHYLPNWYPLVTEFTAETKFFTRHVNLAEELKSLDWGKFFIKDYVKSLKTSVGSVISEPGDIVMVLKEMEKFRGTIEGGICVRRFEEYIPNSERRYFVLRGTPHAMSGPIPELVTECAGRIPSPFYSVDVAVRADGALRLIEIGDGQVSDIVGWEAARFAAIWNAQPPDGIT